jgi:hypothetical protein
MLFANNIILVGELRKEINGRLDTWRRALEIHGFCLNRNKTISTISLAKDKTPLA